MNIDHFTPNAIFFSHLSSARLQGCSFNPCNFVIEPLPQKLVTHCRAARNRNPRKLNQRSSGVHTRSTYQQEAGARSEAREARCMLDNCLIQAVKVRPFNHGGILDHLYRATEPLTSLRLTCNFVAKLAPEITPCWLQACRVPAKPYDVRALHLLIEVLCAQPAPCYQNQKTWNAALGFRSCQHLATSSC